LAGLVYYSGLNFARDVGTFYSLLFWDVCSGVVWTFEGKLKNLKECLILFFFILRNQQTAGCSSLTEFTTKELLVLVISTNLKEPMMILMKELVFMASHSVFFKTIASRDYMSELTGSLVFENHDMISKNNPDNCWESVLVSNTKIYRYTYMFKFCTLTLILLQCVYIIFGLHEAANVNICRIHLYTACVNVFGCVSVTVNTKIICKVTLSLGLLAFQTFLSRVSIK
jgi:hypothetical protein